MAPLLEERAPGMGLAAFPLEPDRPDDRRGRRRRRRLRVSFALLLAFGVLAFPIVSVTHTHDLVPWIGYRVQGIWHYSPPGIAFDTVAARFGLKPSAGALLDVEGQVLRAGAYPGAILLDGRTETGNPQLAEGDEIKVVNGRNHVEPLVQVIVRIPGGKPSNPQFYLGTTPGDQIITKGKISGKVVSSVFHSLGPGSRPNSVALTFGDGPWPDQTLKVLAVLKKFKVKATFFVIGYLALRYPDIVRAEAKAGMAIGDHSWDHPNTPFRDLPSKTILDEIAKTKRYLGSIGIASSVFRPPGGSYSDLVIQDAAHFRMRVIIWSVDPKDWQRPTAAEIVKRVLSQVRPGSIILIHDGGGDRSATLAALPLIIKGIRKMGLGFATLEP